MKLDAYLKAHKLTEAEFGQMIGRSQAAINRYRNGKRDPGLKDMAAIAAVTKGKVQPKDFFPDASA